MLRTGLLRGSKGILASSYPSSSLRAPIVGGRWYSSQDGNAAESSRSPLQPGNQQPSYGQPTSSSTPAPSSNSEDQDDLFFALAPRKTDPSRADVAGQAPLGRAFTFGDTPSDNIFGQGTLGFRSEEEEIAMQETFWRSRKPLGEPPATPSTGRTVKVVDHDVSGAINICNSIMSKNQIPAQLRSQLRYEKPNEMRNRIKRERRRTHFAAMIRRKVQLVLELKNRGGA